MVFPFALLPSNVESSRGAELLLGQAASVDGRKFQLSRWNQGRIEPPNSEGELVLPFSHSTR